MPWMGVTDFTNISKYNYSDLNRENTNIQYLYDQLLSYGYPVTLVNPTITNYSRTDFPKVSDIKKARENILGLIAGFYSPNAPTVVVNTARIQSFGYTEANVLELNLKAIYDLLNSVIENFVYSGTFISGEDVIL